MDEEEKFFKLLEQDSQREVLQYQNEVADHMEITHLPKGITSVSIKIFNLSYCVLSNILTNLLISHE